MLLASFISLFFLLFIPFTQAIKFNLRAYRFPREKCFWNTAHDNQLVIVTANVGPGGDQRIDIQIVDSSPQKNVYLSKKNIQGETRLAITTHVEGEVGVCFKNYLGSHVSSQDAPNKMRVIDLDVDIGADAVDYNAIANQESLSGLETEMRKIEGLVKEIQDEMDYLQRREERFTNTNSKSDSAYGKLCTYGPSSSVNTSLTDRVFNENILYYTGRLRLFLFIKTRSLHFTKRFGGLA
ncbi:hypothetical protein Clacol_009423 [Clathrus columnatus]|uniref:GOLD domain-containing protein n=1 Tax=Clathrus columnatus TaxID=1419009 RepID=A0AAV5AR30_9AGAM|nr:hypothetical protein Clacol_009423 [Clathrus columnatus]